MRADLVRILTQAGPDLIREIDPDHGFFPALRKRRVLTEWQVASCQAKGTSQDKLEAVLGLLEKCRDESYTGFRDVLQYDIERPDIVKDFLPAAHVGRISRAKSIEEEGTDDVECYADENQEPPVKQTKQFDSNTKMIQQRPITFAQKATVHSGVTSTQTTTRRNTVTLGELPPYIGSTDRTPELRVKLHSVSDICTPRKRQSRVRRFFEVKLDDGTTNVITGVVYDKPHLHHGMKSLEGKSVRIDAGTYTVEKPTAKFRKAERFYLSVKERIYEDQLQ